MGGVDPGQDVAPYHLGVEVAQQHVMAAVVKGEGLAVPGRRRKTADHGQGRPARDDVVLAAVEDQRPFGKPWRGGLRPVHQPDQSVDGFHPRALDHPPVAAERAQHVDVVRRLDVEALGGQAKGRDGMGRRPQRRPLVPGHGGAAPDGGGGQDHAVGLGPGFRRPRPGDQGDGAAHAVAQDIDRNARMAAPHQGREIREVADIGLGPRPQADADAVAEAPLVIGIGRDPAVREPGTRGLEEVGIVVEPVKRDDDRLGRALGPPRPHGHADAVAGNEPVHQEMRFRGCRSRRIGQRHGAGREQSA